MTSFRLKFEEGLQKRGVAVTHFPGQDADAVLVIGGTRHLLPLWRAKQKGIRIIQRLDGINWVHRRRKTGLWHFLRAEYGNFILAYIRRRIATDIVYQSDFSKKWWDDWYGPTQVFSTVVHNGVELDIYSPTGPHQRPVERFRLLVVEGSLGGGYELGLDNAICLAETLEHQHGFPMELMAVGKTSEDQKTRAIQHSRIPILFTGTVPLEKIPEIDRSAHLFFSSDINPACPNAVIEALACGLPVTAFNTGALSELVIGDSGRLVPYGGDLWNFEPPDIPALAEASAEILRKQAHFRKAARAQAEKALGVDKMVEAYLNVLLAA
jgi:glycosyltransferase involved in cell wall biosynthesis